MRMKTELAGRFGGHHAAQLNTCPTIDGAGQVLQINADWTQFQDVPFQMLVAALTTAKLDTWATVALEQSF